MKKINARLIAFAVMFAVMFSTIAVSQTQNAYAASIALNATSKTVVAGNTYTLSVKNATNMSKTSWKSSNTKVATVNGKGLVTSVAPGTATITATVYFKDGTQKQLSSKITVKKRIPATSVTLNVVHDEINAHIIEVGSKYDFNTKLTPSTSTDSTYYSISDTTYATVNSAGIVTGVKPGITVLEARIGVNKTEAMKSTNKVVARTYILVRPKTTPTVTPTPTPTPVTEPKALGVSLVSSNEIKITFNTPIRKSSVIDGNGNLISGAITITPGNKATALGNLSAKLSKDLMELNIIASGEFAGVYVTTIFNKTETVDGTPVQAAAFQNDFVDTKGPTYTETTISDNGYKAQIQFSEAIDISKLSILQVYGESNTYVKNYIGNANNYILSSDKKTLTIDLMATGQKVVNAMVEMTGIKDLKGNEAEPYVLSVIVRCDATEKALANIVKVERINKTQLTATFDAPIETAGYAKIDGLVSYGTVDPDNNKKVNYTIINTNLTGNQLVTFSGWRNYNASYSVNANQTRAVDFTLDTTPPILLSYELTSSMQNGVPVNKLILNYNKTVSLTNISSSLSALVYSNNGNILPMNFTYTGSVEDKTVTLTLDNLTLEGGTYNITIPKDFVLDNLSNASLSTTIQVQKSTGSSSNLPAPSSVIQDASNPSKLIVTFNYKLDLASVANVSNYTLGSYTNPISAVIEQQDNNKAVVVLTFANGAITNTGTHALTIRGLKGYNGSYGEMKVYNTTLTLIENTAATVVSCKQVSPYGIEIELSKPVTGTGTFQVYTGSSYVSPTSCYVSGKVIYLSFNQAIGNASYLILTNNYFVDYQNNAAIISSPLSVQRTY
ncbi:Ig-like domain-containing protein [Lachnoclostridium phytofermentans]|uniref:Ig-like domain-containing protein n=1 Tax=Lachnoclostridium phytofermentans TaxID=66219 RepID=UPI00068F9F58|nr:Ig-like domain-containing protein [Lachnoclostridium phytofermentans]